MNRTPAKLELKDIECPHCHQRFALSEAVQRSLADQVQSQVQGSLAEERHRLEESLKKEAQEDLKKALESERKKAAALLAEKELEYKAEKEVRDKSIEKQKELLKQNAELEDKVKSFELTILERVKAAKQEQDKETREALDAKTKLEKGDLERKLEIVSKQLEDAHRKINQGSQEAQGEVLEEQFQDALGNSFGKPDKIREIKKGARGADMALDIHSPQGVLLGSILFETKRTEKWNSNWIEKIKGDLLENRADVGVIIATNLPDGVRHFDQIEGVYIASPTLGLKLAAILRETIVSVAREKNLQVNMEDKAQVLYNYFRSSEFKQRVERVVRAVLEMRMDLEKEKNAMQRLWSARDEQIQLLSSSFASLVGKVGQLADVKDIPELELGGGTEPALPKKGAKT
jgi:hypothetical protein